MSKFLIGIGIFIAVVFLGLVYGFLDQQKYSVSVQTVKVGNAVLETELADSPVEHARGLSGRPNLAKNQSLLFLFPKAGSYGFWMRGMRFPLDIIWIAGNKVVGIEKNIPADSADTYYPPEPVDKVLEINAGLSDKLGFQAGDELLDY